MSRMSVSRKDTTIFITTSAHVAAITDNGLEELANNRAHGAIPALAYILFCEFYPDRTHNCDAEIAECFHAAAAVFSA
jgi:hypothetical protein